MTEGNLFFLLLPCLLLMKAGIWTFPLPQHQHCPCGNFWGQAANLLIIASKERRCDLHGYLRGWDRVEWEPERAQRQSQNGGGHSAWDVTRQNTQPQGRWVESGEGGKIDSQTSELWGEYDRTKEATQRWEIITFTTAVAKYLHVLRIN